MLAPRLSLTNRLKDQKGSALLLCIFVLLILTVLGLASTENSSMEIDLAANERDYQKALYAAESGIEHMRAVLQNNMISGNQANLASNNPVDFSYALTLYPQNSPLETTLGNYTYEVWNTDNDDDNPNPNQDDDRLIYVTSVATGPNNSTATIQVLLGAQLTAESLTGYSSQAGGGAEKTNTSSDVSAISNSDLSQKTTLDHL